MKTKRPGETSDVCPIAVHWLSGRVMSGLINTVKEKPGVVSAVNWNNPSVSRMVRSLMVGTINSEVENVWT